MVINLFCIAIHQALIAFPNISGKQCNNFQIYSAGVSVFLGGNKPSRDGNIRGDISVNFSCDPDISSTLVSLLFCTHFLLINLYLTWQITLQVSHALDEIQRLQDEGPSDNDVAAILEIEQRAHENGLQVTL